MVQITAYDGDLCTVSDPDIFEAGDEIIHRAYITDSDEVLKTLEAHWRPRWSTTAQVSESDWQKITQFAKVYMTQHNFTWQPITRTQWPNTVKQFKARAARCPDGFDRCDLQFMPDSFVDSIIHLVNSIETEDVAWPQQLMFGTVVGLAKHDQAHDESHYRTIMLVSTLYRAWAKLHAKQPLRQLAMFVPMRDRAGSQTLVRWIPSHMDPSLAEV